MARHAPPFVTQRPTLLIIVDKMKPGQKRLVGTGPVR